MLNVKRLIFKSMKQSRKSYGLLKCSGCRLSLLSTTDNSFITNSFILVTRFIILLHRYEIRIIILDIHVSQTVINITKISYYLMTK